MSDAPDVVAIVAAAVDAGKSQYTKKKQKVIRMGNSTGSMFYAFGAFLLIYLVGVSIYQIYLWIKRWRENREEKED